MPLILIKVTIKFVIAETEINLLLLWQKLYFAKRNTFTLDTAFTIQQYLHDHLHDLVFNFYSLEHFHEFLVKYPINSSMKYMN